MNIIRSALLAFLLIGAPLLNGCFGSFTTAAVKSMKVYERLEPKQIAVLEDGTLIITVSTTYYRRTVFDSDAFQGGGKPVRLNKNARDRLVVISPADMEKILGDLKSRYKGQPGSYSVSSLTANSRYFFYSAVTLPEKFWGESQTMNSLNSPQHYTLYSLDKPIAYPSKDGTVLLDFSKMKLTSERTKTNISRAPVIIPALGADCGVVVGSAAVAVIAIPVAIILSPFTLYVLIFDEPPANSHPDQPTPKQKPVTTTNE